MYRGGRKGVFFFRSMLAYQEGEALRESVAGMLAAFTPAVIIFVALPETEDADPG